MAKKRNHGERRDFPIKKQTKPGILALIGLDVSANTFGAQHFLHQPITFHHGHFLQVGAKSPLSSLLRPRPVSTKSGFLTTMCTARHF
jgi:hypothetical protein